MTALRSLFLGLLLASNVPAQTLPPEPPALMRTATGVVLDTAASTTTATYAFTRPHIPAFRTTEDGRIGLVIEAAGPEGGGPRFTLLQPEKMTQAFLNNPASAYTMIRSGFKWLDGFGSASQSSKQFTVPNPDGLHRIVAHATLWETAPPSSVSGEDVYSIKVFGSTNWTDANGKPRTQFFVTPIKIYVSNPKTVNSFIRSIVRDTSAPNGGATVAGPAYNFNASGFEPAIVGDGRLLVVRLGSGALPWTDEAGGVRPTQAANICYSYYTGAEPADPTLWTTLMPISHAPFDARIKTKFGFAMAPFRDPEGKLIPDGEDLGGSYPWMDRAAKNLFFETLFDQLRYLGTTPGVYDRSRYPNSPVAAQSFPAGNPGPTNSKAEDGGKHQGVAFCGLWSHGKIVLIDNMVNDTDYAISNVDNPVSPTDGHEQRMVQLFQADPYRSLDGWLRMGYGRSTTHMPYGENDNANIIDSIENLFNYRQYAKPISLRDVAWPVSVGKQTDEVSFDDYIDPDAFIIANMAGSLTFNDRGTGANIFTHNSGWITSTNTFSSPVKLQNAATAPTARWNLPAYGLVCGPGRLEPAAVGGVHGKGFWMDGTIGLEFTVPAQSFNVSTKDWYVGLFVDSRSSDDTTERRLVTFPDNSTISIIGRHQIVYAKAGVTVHRITLPTVLTTTPVTQFNDLLPDTSWAHLAFQVRKSGTEVDFHLNGLVFNRWQDGYTSLFQVPSGSLTLGRPNLSTINGFVGWLDDFKMIAHSVDLETACNHANGTLIGLPSTYTGDWKTKFADRFPSWTHDVITTALKNNGETTYPKYACYYNYIQDNAAHRFTIPAGTVSLRQSFHFPEGPLFHNKPRPHSVQNQFCITCHATPLNGVGNGGLDLDGITFDNTFNADRDPRRQPMQPNSRIYGTIPAGLIDTTGLPATATALTAAGQLIDQWMQPAFGGTTTVQSYSIVDAATGLDLASIVSGGTIDPARLGTKNLTIRANLDSAQGYVNMQYDATTVNQRVNPPYAVFGTISNPLAGQVMTVGAHTMKATPQYGALNTLNFTVIGNTSRVVADYRDDFKTHAPLPGWSYLWNELGSITNAVNYVNLAWRTAGANYSGRGSATFPEASTEGAYVQLSSTGGHPGRGSAQQTPTTLPDRFAIAAYTVKLDGYYAVSSGFVTATGTAGNGGQVIVNAETLNADNVTTTVTQKFISNYAAGTTLNLTSINTGFMRKGDTIYVCVGPNTTDGGDTFSMDFSIFCNELMNPF